MYQHCAHPDQQPIDLPVGKVVCVGRNYHAHILELNNALPVEPVLFMKPAAALVPLTDPIALQGHQDCHHEVEVAVLIQSPLQAGATSKSIEAAIYGYGIALDLTRRNKQTTLKQQGLPWERAKAFDGACPLSPIVPKASMDAPEKLDFSLSVNGMTRQIGNTQKMIYPILELITNILEDFRLSPGDVILTGTPEGVAALTPGDELVLALGKQARFNTHVVD